MELEQGFLLIITGNSKLLKDSIFSPYQPFPYSDIPNFYKPLKGPNQFQLQKYLSFLFLPKCKHLLGKTYVSHCVCAPSQQMLCNSINIYRIKERYGWKNTHSIKLNIPKLGMNEWPLLNSFRIAYNSSNMQVWRETKDF